MVISLNNQFGRFSPGFAKVSHLAGCRWLKEHNNVLVIGPTGVGKTYLACALAQKACREGYGAFYFRLPRLLHELSIAKADGRYDKLLAAISRIDLLLLDDCVFRLIANSVPIDPEQRSV